MAVPQIQRLEYFLDSARDDKVQRRIVSFRSSTAIGGIELYQGSADFQSYEDLQSFFTQDQNGCNNTVATSISQTDGLPIKANDQVMNSVFIRYSADELLRVALIPPEDEVDLRQVFARPWYPGCPLESAVGLVGQEPDWKALQALLKDCTNQGHQICNQPATTDIGGICVIDVRSRQLQSYRTCSGAPYATLSYCWGKIEQRQVDRSRPLPVGLPRTIENAITAVDKLGIAYLWVDSICIDQDDATEKASQIAIMDQIYEGAAVTIVALDGLDANSGLAGVGGGPKRTPQLKATFGSVELLSRLPTLEEQLRQSTWMKRAWTFQEGILSRKCIFFTRHQVYFRCQNLSASEDQRLEPKYHRSEVQERGSPDTLNAFYNPCWDTSLVPENADGVRRAFNSILQQYATRRVSYESDFLVAFSGLLNRLQRGVFLRGFLWGIPRSRFREGLLWHAVGKARRRNVDIPSWTWAGWEFSHKVYIYDHMQHFSRPPLQIWHKAHSIDVDLDADRLFRDDETTNNVVGKVWANIPRAQWEGFPGHKLPSAEGALLVKGLVLTIPCKSGINRYTSEIEITFALQPDITFTCPGWYLGGNQSHLGTDYRRQRFLFVNTLGSFFRRDKWGPTRPSTSMVKLQMLLLVGQDSVLERAGVVEIDFGCMFNDETNRLGLDDFEKYAQIQYERFWLV